MSSHDNLKEFLNGIFAVMPEEMILYEEAFIHSSNNSPHNNQRLAFLGDSVLRLIIREHFYRKNPGLDKGELTKICGEEKESNKNFANIAIKLGLVKYMNIENPPFDYETNEKLNAEVLEALFGAIYLNRGFEGTKKIAENMLLNNWQDTKNMDKKIILIKSICDALVKKDINSAKGKINNDWKFEPSSQKNKKNIPIPIELAVFNRDHFTCRYCGKHTIFKGILRLISFELPEEFPYHKNWKWEKTHPAYYELTASCDHLKPVAREGNNNIENLVTTCYMCNSNKNIWTLDELRWKLRDIDNSEWDGLVRQFIQLMEQTKIEDNSLRRYYEELIKT